MQDKEKFYNSSPMKYIKLEDIINHDYFNKPTLTFIDEEIGDMFLKFLDFDPDLRKIDYVIDKQKGTIVVENYEEYNNLFFSFAKLHWLIHDLKLNGVSFPPQGHLLQTDNDKKFIPVMHPGTFRYLALMFLKKYDEHIVVGDKYNYFPQYPKLSFEEHKTLVNSGFIRERKGAYAEVETTQGSDELIYTVHETHNHHDWNIILQAEQLIKMYTKFNVYTDDEECVKRLNLISEQNIEIKIIENGYSLIPYKENFEGVSVYIPKSECMEDVFKFSMIYYLDFDHDIVYFVDTGVCIINNGTIGCKRLIPEIVEESKPEYLNRFLWARRVVRI